MKQKISKGIRLLAVALVCVMGLSVASPAVTTQAAAYGKKLSLNSELKFNKTVTNTKTAKYYESTFFPTLQKGKVDIKVKCTRKKSGSNYVATYKVTYTFKKNPKLQNTEMAYDDWHCDYITQQPMYTVFDYKTGKCLESTKLADKLGIKVETVKDFKITYYDKQYYTLSSGLMSMYPDVDSSDLWIRNYKKITYTFKVTYPKSCKRAVVAIGFGNAAKLYEGETANKKYWDGTGKWGATDYYKCTWYDFANGKKKTTKGQFSYMRLK